MTTKNHTNSLFMSEVTYAPPNYSVVGTRRWGNFSRWLVGRNSKMNLQKSPCFL